MLGEMVVGQSIQNTLYTYTKLINNMFLLMKCILITILQILATFLYSQE